MKMELKIPSIQKCDTLRYPDLEIRNEGSIFLVDPRTDAGAKWIGELIEGNEEVHFFGQALVVEHRFIEEIVGYAIDAGLKVV